VTRALAFLPLLLVAAVGVAGAAAPPPTTAQPVARAIAVQVVVPGQPGVRAAAVEAGGQASAPSFAYPVDGSALRVGAVSASAAGRGGSKAVAQAVADVLTVQIFGGEVSAESVAARAQAQAAAAAASASTAGSAIVGLVALGQPIAPAPGKQVPLADWGYLVTLGGSAGEEEGGGARAGKASVTALRVVLTAAHGGLPAGSEIQIGVAEASAAAMLSPAPRAETGPAGEPPLLGPAAGDRPPAKTTPRPTATPKQVAEPPEPKRGEARAPAPVLPPPPDVLPNLTAEGYVFPVWGNVGFSSSFGAPRANVGWHHGIDIFAPLGTPVLAVTDGTLFSVGWNDLGGYRLWLRDDQGNQFYFAHLSAFSPLAVNGNRVRAGQVIGFVGATGDADGTPPHLHFEIHPAAMLDMGYDGVVDPYPYLLAWRRAEDISFAVGSGWAPPAPALANAPRPGAILLQAADISSATGLDPASLRRALAPSATENGALARG
jgi:murein DD-endopeptidase MepM/ murein hydrolase activator NlpD